MRLETMTLHLDTVFIGSCNADHLTAFKQIPDFASFKARIELVQVPYLLDYPRESHIYWELLRTLSGTIETWVPMYLTFSLFCPMPAGEAPCLPAAE